MPATTYLGEKEATRPTGDPDIDELLKEVREVSGEDWRVERFEYDCGLLWWRRRRQIYTLYNRVSRKGAGVAEFQIINFAPDDVGGWSINHETSRSHVIAYLHGMLGALKTFGISVINRVELQAGGKVSEDTQAQIAAAAARDVANASRRDN